MELLGVSFRVLVQPLLFKSHHQSESANNNPDCYRNNDHDDRPQMCLSQHVVIFSRSSRYYVLFGTISLLGIISIVKTNIVRIMYRQREGDSSYLDIKTNDLKGEI